MMTGSWYGGAMFGAMMGMLVMGGLSTKNDLPANDPPARAAEQEEDDTE